MRHYGACIPNNMASERTFEDLDLTKDEVKRLGEALKDEKFRKMLVEYAEEISNPENRRKAEEEIAMLENERGMSVQFIHPEPGYVMKTTVDGTKKAFINICQNDKIEKPKSNKQTGPDGKSGFMWHIPHSFAPPKEDHDKAKTACTVFDVVFHPDTYRMAMSNARFKKLVEDTAVEGIERQFGVTLDKKNIRYPKLTFKGAPTATVIRQKLPDAEQKTVDDDSILSQMPYPYGDKSSSEKSKENETKNVSKNANKTPNGNILAGDSKYTKPKYTITHRSELDMSEYRNAPDARTSTRPKELVIKIELPLLKSAAQANLDIFEKRLVLESVSPAAYKLDLPLPFPVNEDEGSAKFDKSKKTLTITLPVLPSAKTLLPFSQVGESDEKLDETSPPLVEVVSNGADMPDLHNELVDQNSLDLDTTSCESIASVKEEAEKNHQMKFPQNVKWILPDHQFSQDNETVSFVVKVENVEEKSVEMFFPQSTTAVVQFMSIGAGCFPVYYSLFVEFPKGCDISSEHSNVDVSDDNLVFVILKDKQCRGLWDSFSIGIDDSHLEKKQFLTETNLQKELFDLDLDAAEEANMPLVEETTPVLSVMEMNERKLTIDIKPSKGKKKKSNKEVEEDENEEYDPPSSSEIEVVHKHPLPELHSILKQRTVSESSEDIGSLEPESPRSESEELSSSFSKKRSVSFNNHVDRASFKSSASVSSMTPALKSKRRRQRKRDAKIRNRVRHNSEGTSSSEESLHIVADSYSHSEGEECLDKSHDEKRSVMERCLSDPGPDGHCLFTINDVEDEKERGAGEPGKKRKTKHCVATADSGSIPHTEDILDFRTKIPGSASVSVESDQDMQVDSMAGKMNQCSNDDDDMDYADEKKTDSEKSMEPNAMDKNKKIISEIKSKLARSGDQDNQDMKEEDSDDDNFVDAVSSVAEEFRDKVGFNKSYVNTTRGPSENKSCDEIPQQKLVELESMDESSSKVVNSDKSDLKHSSEEKSEVETMLSWEDGKVDGEDYATQCAFLFTNSVMFDLDLD